MLQHKPITNHTQTGRWAQAGRAAILFLFLVSTIFSAALSSPRSAFAQDGVTPPADPAAPEAPVANPVLSTSILGLEMTPVANSGGLYWAKQTGYSRWVRGPEIIWKDVETSPGVYDWTKINNAVTEIKNAKDVSNGGSVIVIVRGTPSFYQANPPFSCGPIKPVNYGALANFMFNLINELEFNRSITYVKHWEIWNEPDIPRGSVSDPDQPWGGCWGDPLDPYYGGQKYGDMLKAIYNTIKTRDPAASVIIGGLNLDCDPNNPPDDPANPGQKKDCKSALFLEGVLRAGSGANYFDGVAFHAFDYATKDTGGNYLLGQYSNFNWPGSAWNQNGPALVQKTKYIQTMLANYAANIGPGAKIIMNTENALLDAPYATNTNPYPPILETTKSYYVAQANAAAYSVGLKANIWYDVTGTWLRNNGLVKLDTSDSLEAFSAYSFMATSTGNTGSPLYIQEFRYLNPISYPGVAGHEFGVIPTTSSGLNPYHIWMLWSKDGTIHQITLPTPSPAVYGVKGNLIYPISPATTIQTLDITPQPYYIIMYPVLGRSRLPFVRRSLFNGNFENGFSNWVIASTPTVSGWTASLQTTNPKNPLDPTGATLDMSVPNLTASALLGNSSLGFGQKTGTCSYPNVPVGFVNLSRAINVPPLTGGATAKLKFNYIIYSQDSSGATVDRFEVYIQPINPDGTPVSGTTPVMVFADGNTAFVYANRCRWYRVPSSENPRTDQSGDPSITSGWAAKTIDLTAYSGKLLGVQFRLINRPDGWFNTYAYLDNVTLKITPGTP